IPGQSRHRRRDGALASATPHHGQGRRPDVAAAVPPQGDDRLRTHRAHTTHLGGGPGESGQRTVPLRTRAPGRQGDESDLRSGHRGRLGGARHGAAGNRGEEVRLPRRSGPACGRLLFVLLLFGLSRAVSAADSPNLIRLEITIGKSQVVELKEAFTRVSVTNPAIADVFVITPTQILINGKAVGTTSLIVFYPGRTMFFDVMVHTDVDLLKERLAQIAPRDEIQVYPTQDALVLSGSASSSLVIDQAAEMASVFAPKGKVINLL